MLTDVIVTLRQNHKEISSLFTQFEAGGQNATTTKDRLVDKIIELPTVHDHIENEDMYPRVRKLVPDFEDDVLES
jgi:hemerythrin superfamily protein